MSCDGLVVEPAGGWVGGGGGGEGEGGEDRGEEVEEEKEEEVETGHWDNLPDRWQRRRRDSLSLLCRRLLSYFCLVLSPKPTAGHCLLFCPFLHQSQSIITPLI